MRGFLANRDGVLDVIPVDTVINAMLAIMPRLAHRDTLQVYHVATSVANPLVIDSFVEFVSDHFKNTPMVSPLCFGKLHPNDGGLEVGVVLRCLERLPGG